MPIEFHPIPSSDDFVSSALHDHCIIRITTDSCSLHEDSPQGRATEVTAGPMDSWPR
jgi:hypothetical protein